MDRLIFIVPMTIIINLTIIMDEGITDACRGVVVTIFTVVTTIPTGTMTLFVLTVTADSTAAVVVVKVMVVTIIGDDHPLLPRR